MTRYRCTKGCMEGGQPMYHDGKWACPKEEAYNPTKVAKVGSAREQLKAAMRNPDVPPPPAPAPTPAAPKSGLTGLSVTAEVAETARRDNAKKPAEDDWLLDSEHCETLYEFGLRMLREFTHFVDDVLQAKKTEEGVVKDELFVMNPFDRNAARTGFGQRFATKVVKSLGAKTLAQGQETIDSLALLGMFFTTFFGVGRHLWNVVEQSPRLKKMREEAAKAGGKGSLLDRIRNRKVVETTGRDLGPAAPAPGTAG